VVITLCVQHAGKDLRIGWVSLQDDGAISVGLNGRALTIRDFEARQFVWSAFNRETLAFVTPDDPAATRSVIRPHMTFHPPSWLHLTDGFGRHPFEAIPEIALAVQQQGTVPWIRFVSKPVTMLTEARGLRTKGEDRIIRIPVASPQCSVGLSVDFVAAADRASHPGALHSEVIDWHGYRIKLSAQAMPTQRATLGWFHQR